MGFTQGHIRARVTTCRPPPIFLSLAPCTRGAALRSGPRPGAREGEGDGQGARQCAGICLL